MKKGTNKGGATIEWTEEKKKAAIDEILDRITEGESVRKILNKDRVDLPSNRLFIEWLEEDEQLSKQYARACEMRQELIFDEILDIADDNSGDLSHVELKYDANKKPVVKVVANSEFAARSKVKIDARQWVLSRMNPKKYGNKADVDLTSNGERIKIELNLGTDKEDEAK